MFKNNKKVDPTVVETVIGENVVIEGKINSQTSIRIDGKVIGEVFCAGNITIGEKGIVEADISSHELLIAGSVDGNVKASERLEIKSTGTLTGEIKTKTFIIDEGGTFLGKSNMSEQASKANAKETKESKTTESAVETEESKNE